MKGRGCLGVDPCWLTCVLSSRGDLLAWLGVVVAWLPVCCAEGRGVRLVGGFGVRERDKNAASRKGK